MYKKDFWVKKEKKYSELFLFTKENFL